MWEVAAIEPDNPEVEAPIAPDTIEVEERHRPWVTLVLLGLNLAAFAALTAAGGATDSQVLLRLGAQMSVLVWAGEPWRLLTSLFLHAGLVHLGFNMWALYSLGPAVERLYGRWRFLAIYLLSGLTGNLLFQLVGDPFVPSVGASGAIFGLFGGLVTFGLIHRRRLRADFWRAVLIPIVVNLVYGLTAPGINNWAHLGGLLGGLAAAAALGLSGQPRTVPANWASLGLAVVLVGLIPLALRPAGWYQAFEQGRVLTTEQRWGEAAMEFEQAVAGRPDWAYAHYALGLSYLNTERKDLGVAELQQAVRLNPGLTAAREVLAEVGRP